MCRPWSSSPARATAARHGLLLIVILGSLTALAPLAIDLYLPALPALGDDLGASTSLVQLTLTACVVGLGVGQLVAGPLADRYGRRPPLLVGLAGFAVSSGVCALAPTVEILVGLRFVQGATGAAGLVIARAVVRDVYGPAATRIFAALLLVTGLAPVVAPIVGAQMLHFTTWRGTFVVLLGLGVALLVATWLGLGESLAPDQRRADGLRATLVTLRGLVADRSFMPYVACFALTFGAFFAYISASPFVLEDIHGVSPQVFSAIFAVNSAALIGAAQVAGHVSGRLVEPHRLLYGGVGLVAISAVALLADRRSRRRAVAAARRPDGHRGGQRHRHADGDRARDGGPRARGGQRVGAAGPVPVRPGRHPRPDRRRGGQRHRAADGGGHRRVRTGGAGVDARGRSLRAAPRQSRRVRRSISTSAVSRVSVKIT